MFWKPPKNSKVGTRLSGVFFHSKFDTACSNILLFIHWMLVGYSWYVLLTSFWNDMFLTFKDRETPLSTIFSQLLIREQGQCCKLKMLICITNVRVVFPSSPGFISVVFPMFSWEVYICLSTASNMSSKFTVSHPSTCKGAVHEKHETLASVLL